MRHLKSLFLLVFTSTLLIGCMGSESMRGSEQAANQEAVDSAPDWYMETPSDSDYLLATATATSRSMQTAVDKAKTQARSGIATQLQTRLDNFEQQFTEEVSQGDNSEFMEQFTQATEAVASETLVGSRIRERELKTEDDLYRAYVLMEMPIGEAQAALLSKIKQSEELRTRARGTEVFKEMEKEVEEYNQSREDNQQ